jgi:hypothetical protein
MAGLCQRGGSDRRAVSESRGERANPGIRIGDRRVAAVTQRRGFATDIVDETTDEQSEMVWVTGL